VIGAAVSVLVGGEISSKDTNANYRTSMELTG